MKRFFRVAKYVIVAACVSFFVLRAGATVIYPRSVYDVGQRGVIFYENGTETLVLSTSFAGKANEFAWIIPTPSKPELGKVSNQLFTALDDKTNQGFSGPRDIYPVPLASPSVGGGIYEQSRVRVEDAKEIGYYDTKVLSVGDKAEFLDWLKNEGYSFPSTDSYLLDDYVKQGWYFTVVRIKPEYAGGTVTQSLLSGRSTPLIMKFTSDKMIYPLKLASAKFERVSPLQQSGLVASYSFNEGSGLQVKDASGNNNNGTVARAQWIKDGKRGGALSFDGTGYVSIPYSPSLELSDSFSVSLWFQGSEIDPHGNPSAPVTYRTFVNRGGPGSQRLYLLVDSDGKLWHFDSLSSGIELNDNDWHHFAYTFVASSTNFGTETIYLDGRNVASRTGFVPAFIPTSMTLGLSGGLHGFLGFMDEVRFYNRALTASEVAKDKDSENAVFPSATVTSYSNSNPSYYGNTYDYYYQNQFPVVLYTIADHRKQATGFTTEYAGKISKEEIGKLVSGSDAPWVTPQAGRYFLTRLTAQMQRAGIDNDLTIQNAESDALVNASDPDAAIWFWLIIVSSIVTTFGFAFLLFKVLRVPRSIAP